jgi:uncharacterized protein YecT (DUF1311 family)
MNKYLGVLTIVVSASLQPAAGAGCENPRSSQEVATCLGGELRDSDARINQTYQAVMKLLSEDEQKTLRTEQHSWIKERDMVCHLDTREKDRGQTREKGRWYWEVSINVDEIAKFQRTTLWMGCANPEHAHGGLLNIRTHDTGYGVHAVGVALDLQDGKMYLRNNGSWDKGAPGSAKGLDLKLGRIYKCGLTSTIAVSPLEKLNFVEVNFGSKPFKYALPDGYRPFAP